MPETAHSAAHPVSHRVVRVAAASAALVSLGACGIFATLRRESVPADAAWSIVLGSPNNRQTPMIVSGAGGTPAPTLRDLVAAAGREFSWTEGWLPSPDGRRVAFIGRHYVPAASTTAIYVAETSYVAGTSHAADVADAATAAAPPQEASPFREICRLAGPIAWSPDGTRLLCWTRGTYVLVDVDGGATRTYGGLGTPPNSLGQVAFSPDGRQLAITTTAWQIRLLDLETGTTEDARLPETAGSAQVIGWTDDERIAYLTDDRRLALARPGDAAVAAFIPLAAGEVPFSVRPDGGAALCTMHRPGGLIYVRWGSVVRCADGRAVDLDNSSTTTIFQIGAWLRTGTLPPAYTR